MNIEFVEAISKKAKEVVGEIHTAFPGRIESIDYDKGTASVQPYALFEDKVKNKILYPVIHNVPIIVPQSSVVDTCVAYPIMVGDSCLVIISEGTTNYWKYNRVTEIDSKFDLSNAICIPGLMRKFNPCFREAAQEGAVILKYGEGVLRLTNDTLTIRAKNLDIQTSGSISMTASGNVNVSSGGNLGLGASGNTTVTGANVNIN